MRELMQITVLVPAAKVHKACVWLEENGATAMMVKAVTNGHDNGHAKGSNDGSAGNAEVGKAQREWLAKHMSKPTATPTLKEAWAKAGFNPDSIYPALARALKLKVLKKVKPGVYVRRG